MTKLEKLKQRLREFSGVVVAYSGGVDSTFLAVMAREVLGDRALAVTAVSPTYPEQQLNEATLLAKQLELRHQVIYTNEFEDGNFVVNPVNRCYFCKKALFEELQELARVNGLAVILDGANFDDLADYRPGHQAAEELGVISPLQEVGLTKQEIREFSYQLELPTWNKPAYACLASRIPYGIEITEAALHRIDQAEVFLNSLGFTQLRVRDHYPVARIEVGPNEQERLWELRKTISVKLHEFGYPYVTLDLDGFRSGSMNEVLKERL